MRHKLIRTALGVSLVGLLLLTAAASNAQDAGAASGSVTFTVTAVGKKEAPRQCERRRAAVYGQGTQANRRLEEGRALYLAILIDDSIETGAGGQWDYLKEFIAAQPPTTYIAVGYLQNNTTRVAQDFTPDHALAAKALRLPLGSGAIDPAHT